MSYNFWSKAKKVVRLYNMRRTTPLRLEINLTQACNLNCKGCTHYSPLAPKDDAEQISTIKDNVEHLAKIKGAEQIAQLYLIGGETLLYPHINEAIEIVRKFFPETPISLFTNGLMIPKMPDDFWATCRKHGVMIDITRYPIKVDYDRLIDIVRSKGVGVKQFADRSVDNSFQRFPLDPNKRQSARMAHFTCFNYGCLSIIGENLYPCSISGCIGLLNNRFGTNFEHKDGDYLRIADIKNVKEIFRLRNRPVPFCAYCLKPTPTTYGPSSRQLSEWVQQ